MIKVTHIIDGRRDFCRILFGIDMLNVIIEDINED